MARLYNKYRDKHIPAGAVSIMRPGPWGNPYTIGRDGSRDVVCGLFELYAETMPGFKDRIRRELRGKDLVCCCAPLRCHGETLLRIANE